tara:strand:+ start:8590 stop:10548 length:1959 start_codon:yes stop_codon:yes gene_type:complete
MRKKRLLFQSDFSLAKTGFGRCARALLSYLYETDKYDIFHYCCGERQGSTNLTRTPWTSLGALPQSNEEIQKLQAQQDPNLIKQASYGAARINEVIKEVKPDVYIAAQDIWGIDFALQKHWYKQVKSNVALWTTLDSLPILGTAIKAAHETENYWIWSSFATKELNKMGHKHVKTMHGPVDSKYFRKLPNDVRARIRESFGIGKDKKVIGFVFRNQLRKSIPNLMEGYARWKSQNKVKDSALLLHTNFHEGWDIMTLAKEYNVPTEDILTTFVCSACGNYHVTNPTLLEGSSKVANLDCPYCGEKNGLQTTGVGLGVSESQLNDVYNIMDVYCHPFTSGGQEYPIQEAKLCELVTLVTNYSCGEEMCEPTAASLPLEWSEYREQGTQFIKASTCPKSIAKQLKKFFSMNSTKREQMGKTARKWALDNYSIDSVGQKMQEFIDSRDFIDWEAIEIEPPENPINPEYKMPPPDSMSSGEFIIHAYHNILGMKSVDENDDGYKYWMKRLDDGQMSLQKIYEHFVNVAKEQSKKQEFKFEDFLDEEDKGSRMLYVIPESAADVFLSTSLFKSIKEQHPEFNLYVATSPALMGILDGNEYVKDVIPYIPEMDNALFCEGVAEIKGEFEICFVQHLGTMKNLDYLHNGKDNIALDLKF